MTFEEFERDAHLRWAEIPEEFKEGIDALVVHREALPHPLREEVFTLGMCLTESYPSEWLEPDTLRSVVALYWGSFVELAAIDESFDWEEELWETLTHELRHHLESLAREDALEGVDHAMEESFRRWDGEAFDPWYYQSGDEIAPGLYRVEYDYYLECRLPPGTPVPTGAEEDAPEIPIRFSWHGTEYETSFRDAGADLSYLWVEGVETGNGSLQLVVLRPEGWMRKVRRALRKEGPTFLEDEVRAVPARSLSAPPPGSHDPETTA